MYPQNKHIIRNQADHFTNIIGNHADHCIHSKIFLAPKLITIYTVHILLLTKLVTVSTEY